MIATAITPATSASEGVVVAVGQGDLRLEWTVIGGEKISGLIDESRDRCARRARRQFVEMGRDHTPSPLHRDLHDERADRKQDRRRRIGP